MAWLGIAWDFIKALFGLGANKPSAEANAAQGEGVAVTKASVDAESSSKEAAIAQAVADAPTQNPAVVAELEKGAF
jgi:hypothetical protein